MSLIKCSECGREISDKATSCPHCGAPVILPSVEPGQEDANIAGFEESFENANSQLAGDEATIDEVDPVALKKKKMIKITVAVIAGIAVLIVGIIAYQQYNEKQYVKNANAYLESCRLVFNDSGSITDITEHVWYNCIWEEDDSETNPYTKDSGGSFYDDFNDALSNLFDSDKYISKVSKIKSNYSDAQSLYNKLGNPPKDMENTWAAIQTLNKTIVSFKNAAIDPQGNYDQYSTRVNKTYNNASDAYDKLESLL